MLSLAPEGDNTGSITGRLSSRAFLGSITRIAIDHGPLKLHANLAPGATPPADGGDVTVHFPKAALHLLDDAA
jgi:hypothetical protein